jgi:iron complex outermembrane receptor protein
MKINYYKTFCFSASLLAIGLQPIQAQEDDEVYQLNPFSVMEEEEGYMASTTISGTGMRTSLMNIPMSINVITSEFLEDSLTHEFVEALDYNSSITQTGRVGNAGSRPATFALRGFRNRNLLVDGVTGGLSVPTQLIDRIEVVKGPNTLYGQSDPGGLVNIITKTPLAEDGGRASARIGDNGWIQGTLDMTTHAMNGKLGLRVMAEHKETDGWRWVDGNQLNFLGMSGTYDFSEQVEGFFLISRNEEQGFPTERATWSFERIATDLNGDGDFDDSTGVGGITEATARYNNTFIPKEFVTSTPGNGFELHNDFLTMGFRIAITERHNLQYKYNFYDSVNIVSFREFNTFQSFDETDDKRSDVNHTINRGAARDEVHTINDIIDFDTGEVRHQLLLGFRKAQRTNYELGDYRLRQARESAQLDELEADTGKVFRRYLHKNDIESGVPIWDDDVPTWEEQLTYGVRSNNTDKSFQDIDTLYATDNIYFMEDRLNILAGVRHIQINQHTIALGGAQRGLAIDENDTNFQLGAVYRINPNLSAYVNLADAFEANTQTDPDTGDFYTPITSEAIEAGLKFTDLFDGRLGGSATVFQINKDNVVRSDYNPVTFISDRAFTNDESKGFEVELFMAPVENWNIVLGYTYLDSVVAGALNPVLNGLRLEGAAPHRLTFFNSYTFDDGPMEGLRIGGGMVWADGPIQQFGTAPNELVTEDGYTTFDLFARYPTMIGDQPVTFGVNIDNVTDEFFVRSRAATNQARQIVFSATFDL